MKKVTLTGLIFFFLFSMSSCAVAGGIFKAGIWVGVLLVLAVIGLIIYLITRGSNK